MVVSVWHLLVVWLAKTQLEEMCVVNVHSLFLLDVVNGSWLWGSDHIEQPDINTNSFRESERERECVCVSCTIIVK